jgi:hypothetical protein
MKSASLPGPNFLHLVALRIVGTVSQKCPAALTAPVDKITHQFCGIYPEHAKTGAAPRPDVRQAWPQLNLRDVRRVSASKTDTVSSYHPEGRAISV